MNELADIEAVLRQNFAAFRNKNQHFEALNYAQTLLKSCASSPIFWMEYGRILKHLGIAEHALFSFRQAQALNPANVLPPMLIGHFLIESVNGFKSATRGYADTIDPWALRSDELFWTELFNLGLDLFDAGFFEEAISCHLHMLTYHPSFTQSHHIIAASLLCLGRFEEGGARLQKWYEQSLEILNLNIWRGQDLTDKVLVTYADHGLGDTLQFYSYLPALAERCKKLYFRVSPSLWRILGHHPKIELVPYDPAQYDYICSLYIIPHVGGFKPEAVPNIAPFLTREPDMVAKWADRLPKDGFRIGIAWQGNPSTLDRGRSIPVAKYAPLARIPGVTLICLQMGLGLDQLDSLPNGMEVVTLGPDYNAGPDNVVDTAAVMQNLDLIISTDTSVPHIAGGLGCPVWTLLKFNPDWRWLREREDSPWYPTMRLFRQKTDGDWDEVIERVAQALTPLVQAKLDEITH